MGKIERRRDLLNIPMKSAPKTKAINYFNQQEFRLNHTKLCILKF